MFYRHTVKGGLNYWSTFIDCRQPFRIAAYPVCLYCIKAKIFFNILFQNASVMGRSFLKFPTSSSATTIWRSSKISQSANACSFAEIERSSHADRWSMVWSHTSVVFRTSPACMFRTSGSRIRTDSLIFRIFRETVLDVWNWTFWIDAV